MISQMTAQMRWTIFQIEARQNASQSQTTNSAIHCHKTKEDVATLNAKIAVLEAKIAELCIRQNSRFDCIDGLGIHQSIFFLHPTPP